MCRFDPEDFAAVVVDSVVDTGPCPRFDEAVDHGVQTQLGIRIVAPQVVRMAVAYTENGGEFTRDSTVPLCLTVRLPEAFFLGNPRYSSQVTAVVVDQGSGGAACANLDAGLDPSPGAGLGQEPRSRGSYDPVQRGLGDPMTRHLTVNLAHFVRLPPHPATYLVYALVEDFVSNVVVVKLVVP